MENVSCPVSLAANDRGSSCYCHAGTRRRKTTSHEVGMQGIFVCANQPLFWSQQANEAVYTAHGCVIIGKVCAISCIFFECPNLKASLNSTSVSLSLLVSTALSLILLLPDNVCCKWNMLLGVFTHRAPYGVNRTTNNYSRRGGEPNKAACLLCDVVELTGGHMESAEQLITQCSLCDCIVVRGAALKHGSVGFLGAPL